MLMIRVDPGSIIEHLVLRFESFCSMNDTRRKVLKHNVPMLVQGVSLVFALESQALGGIRC